MTETYGERHMSIKIYCDNIYIYFFFLLEHKTETVEEYITYRL